MGILSGMAGATIFGSGRNPVPGLYECLELQKILNKPSSNPKKPGAHWLIGEHTVLAFKGAVYTSVEGARPTIDTSKEFKTGDSVSKVINLSDKMYGKANAAEYIAAVWQAYSNQKLNKKISIEQALAYVMTPEGETQAERLAVGDLSDNLKGLLLRCEAWATTKNDGTEDFTAQKWEAFRDAD